MRLASYQVAIAAPIEVVTTLRLVHHGLPPETVQDHQQGWAHFLGALRDTLSAGR